MSVFSRLFGGRGGLLERELHRMYVEMLCGSLGLDRAEAEREVSNAIALCKEQGRAQGTSALPLDYGDRLLVAAMLGEPKSKRIVEKARNEGATDDDVREWWNLPDLSRRMVLWSENLFRYAVFCDAKHQNGLSDQDAAARVRAMFPMYGDPGDTKNARGEDRPLPHELRGRVDTYRQDRGAQFIAAQVAGFSSYNAFVRHAIREGLL